MADPVPTNDITLSFIATSWSIAIGYTPPDTSPCTVEVSESNTYSPLVNDVNGSLFSGRNLDSASGNLGVGTTSRVAVVGRIPREGSVFDNRGSDRNFYGVALTPNTLYYVRITCGSHTGTGTVTTKNLQTGSTRARAEPIAAPGQLGWPTFNLDAGAQQSIIDPTTGLKMFRFIPSRGTITEPVTSKSVFGSTALGTNWSNQNNILADDSSSAAYSGTSQDWLALKLANFNISNQYFLYAVKLWLKGSATGTGDNAVLQTCISKDGSTCFSDVQEITMSSSAEYCYPNNGTPTTCTNEPSTFNTWKSRASGRPLVAADLSSCASCYVFVRKKGTGAGTITLQYASWDFLTDYLPALYDNGAQQAWSRSTVNDSSSTPGYLLVTRQLGLSNLLWWVNTTTDPPVVRFLGDTYIPADATFSRTYVNGFTSGFSDSDAKIYYGTAADASGNTIFVKGDLPSAASYYDSAKAVNTHASITWSVLTANLESAMQSFDATYDPSSFNCGFDHVQKGTVWARCFYGAQDTLGWLVAVNTSGTIVKQFATWKLPGCRYCGLHTGEDNGQDAEYAIYVLSDLHADAAGGGPYLMNTTSAISGARGDGASFTFTVDSLTPTATHPPFNLGDVAVGDVAVIDYDNGSAEAVRITAINTGTKTITATGGLGPYSPQAHSSGAHIRMGCNAVRWDTDYTISQAVFVPISSDPHGTTTALIDDSNLAGSHHSAVKTNSGGIARVSASGWWSQVGSDETAPTTGTQYSQTRSPNFYGSGTAFGATRCDGNNCQSHPEAPHQFAASSSERNAAFDILPHVGDTGFNPSSCTLVSGSLYDCTPSLSLNRKIMPTLVMFGTKPGVDVSGPSSTIDGTSTYNYMYCVPERTIECSGSKIVGHVYVNAPNIDGSTFFSSGGESSSLAQFDETHLGIGPRNAWVNSFVQFLYNSNDTTGANTRALSYGLFSPMRRQSITASTKISPDGRVVLLPIVGDQGREYDLALAQMPALPTSDGVDRTTLVQRSISLSGPANTATALLEFGYDTNFYPTSRNEVGVSAASNNPYFFAFESYTRATCVGGMCSLNLPMFPDMLAYARAKFYDSGGSLISTGNTFVITDTSSPLSGGSESATGGTGVRGAFTVRGRLVHRN